MNTLFKIGKLIIIMGLIVSIPCFVLAVITSDSMIAILPLLTAFTGLIVMIIAYTIMYMY